MTNEIKKILDYLKETDDKDIYGYVKDKILAYEEGAKLLDYITNLQKKYEEADNDRHKLFEQKEKAIEYIEMHQLDFKKGTTTFGSERLSMEERKLLKILQGEDKH